MKGIDVSSYQGKIDWKKVKAEGAAFAILKIIMRNGTPDKQFESNRNGCAEQGIPVGVYNYSYATTAEKAIVDARKVVSVLGGRKLKHKVWLDVEDDCQKNLGRKLIDIIIAYKNVIENAGYEFGVYTGLSFYNSYIKPYADKINCPFWIARYPSSKVMKLSQDPAENKKPSIRHALWGWQYSSSGAVDGISGKVDMNILYQDAEAGSDTGQSQNSIVTYSLRTDEEKQITKNFKVKEFCCKDGSDRILVDADFIRDKLQVIRDYFGAAVTINSAYRTSEYNIRVGGALNSYHLKGQAFDIVVKGRTPAEVAGYAQSIGITGIIQYNTFVHVDSRTAKYWARNNNGSVTPKSSF